MFTRSQQISAIDTQLARQGLPTANYTALTNAKSNLSSPSLSSLDNLSGYSYGIQSKANMIPCNIVEQIVSKLDNMGNLLETVIDNTFGDSLSSISEFASNAGQAILDATQIDEGLEALTDSIKDFAQQLGVLSGLNIPESSDPCLKEVAQKTYQYLPSDKKAEIDMLNSLSQDDKQSTIKSMTKNLGGSAFNF